jgi:hypothetical protein
MLLISLLVCNFSVLILFRIFKEQGLYLWTILSAIAANIEVLIVIRAFGMEQTLGNIMFASSFLVTDILSELYGKETAKRAVYLGIATSVVFIIVSQTWLMYTPADTDWAMPAMREIFSNTPRMMLAGIVVYVIVQIFDVWAYHKWWAFTDAKFGDHEKYLWLRNNGSTLVSQFFNAVLFTIAAFAGTYDVGTMVSITLSSYVIFIVTSIADTPFVYLARRIFPTNSASLQTQS